MYFISIFFSQNVINTGQKHAQSKDLIETTCYVFGKIEKNQKLNLLRLFFFEKFRRKIAKKCGYHSLSPHTGNGF